MRLFVLTHTCALGYVHMHMKHMLQRDADPEKGCTHISNAQLDVCEAACGSVGNPSASDFGLETHNLIKSTSRDTDNKWPPQKKCECACACVCVSAADANVCRA